MGYFEERTIELYKNSEKDVGKYFSRLEKTFIKARMQVQGVIESFYSRYSKDNKIDYADVQKELSNLERLELKEFIEYSLNGVNSRLLNNVSLKHRLTRYEAILAQIDAILTELYTKQYEEKGIEELKNIYATAYEHNRFNLDKYKGYSKGLSTLDYKSIQKLIDYPFNGANFSTRLWKQKDYLMQALSEDLTLMMVQGKHPNELKKDFAKKFKVKAFEAYRLLHTESSFLTNRATLDGYKEDNIEEYEILGTLDSKTCVTCGEKDGMKVKINDTNLLPPFHPLCRCTIVPYLEPEEGDTRVARDENGEYIDVPSTMNYDEWKEKVIINSNIENIDFMGKVRKFENEKFKIKAYEVKNKEGIFTQTFSKNAQDTIKFIEDMKNKNIIENVSKLVVVKDLPGIASYDHINNMMYVNERLTNKEYINKVLESGYFVAENAEDVIKHEMFHKTHWDNIMTKGKNYDIIKNKVERDLHKYVAEQKYYDSLYIEKTVSKNAANNFEYGLLNELIAEVLLQEDKDIVKDKSLVDLVRRCVK